MAVPFAPAGVSVAEYELRRDVTTREQLRLLEEILKERRRQSRIAKLRLVAGATFACLSLSILYFLVFPKASEPLPFTIHINASAPLQPQSPPVSFTIVQTEATKSGSLTASADVFSTLGTDAQLPSTAANSNSLELCDGDTKESGHSAPRQLSAVDADVYPLNSASAVKEGAAHSSSRDRTDNVATASDAAYLNVQQQPSDRLLRPEHLQGPGAGDTDSNNDRSDIASVSDILQQQHLGQSFSHDQHHQQPQGVALGQSEISSNRPYLSAAVQPNLPSTHEKPQTDEASETHMTSSRVQSLDPAVPSQEQLDILISLFKQGKLSLPDELLAAGNSLDYVNVSTAGLWGNHLADLVDHCLEALGPVVATVGDQWRAVAEYLDTMTPYCWAKYAVAGFVMFLALTFSWATTKCLRKMWRRVKHRQESQTHLESISPANWTSNDKHKRPVQLHADASLAGAHAAEHVTSPNHLHVGPSAKSSPDSVGDPSPGTPVSYSASPALGASSQLLSEPSSPTLDDCQTPAGQVRATGMMTTPANAKPGPAAPPPPPPPPRPSVTRANSVPVPPPPPPPMPGSVVKKTPTPPPPPPPPGTGKGVKGLAGRPTPPHPPPTRGPLSSAKVPSTQAGGVMQSPDAALLAAGQTLAAAVATPEVPSRARQHWQKLKKLHWDQVHGARKGVWLVVNSEAAKINFDRLATRFKVVVRNVKPAEVPKSSVIALLDRTRAMNLAIPLLKLDLKPAEIKAALMTIDGGDLTLENLEALLKMVPTDEEAKNVNLFLQGKHHNHVGVCDVVKLDAAGQYCAEVVGIPNLEQRISSFIFVRHFGDNLHRVTQQLEVVSRACQELRSSKQLSDLLCHVLAVGNFLNGSAGSVSAIGFKLATLLKLTFLRDDNNKSLLHFVLDEMTDAGSISDKLIHQLASTPSAADIQMAGVGKVIAEQTGGLRLVNKVLLQPALAMGATSGEDAELLQDLQSFHQKAEATLSAAQAQYEGVGRALEELSLFFMEVHDVAQPELLLKTMKDFITLFKKTLVEVQAARDQAKAKELRQQRRAAGQPHRSASLPAASLNLGQKAAQARASRLLHRGASQLDAIKPSKAQ